jgi:hypothetical protein
LVAPAQPFAQPEQGLGTSSTAALDAIPSRRNALLAQALVPAAEHAAISRIGT